MSFFFNSLNIMWLIDMEKYDFLFLKMRCIFYCNVFQRTNCSFKNNVMCPSDSQTANQIICFTRQNYHEAFYFCLLYIWNSFVMKVSHGIWSEVDNKYDNKYNAQVVCSCLFPVQYKDVQIRSCLFTWIFFSTIVGRGGSQDVLWVRRRTKLRDVSLHVAWAWIFFFFCQNSGLKQNEQTVVLAVKRKIDSMIISLTKCLSGDFLIWNWA